MSTGSSRRRDRTSCARSSIRCPIRSFRSSVSISRGVDGTVHVGPNAVLAFAREGYEWRTVDLAGDLPETFAFSGFRRFADELALRIDEMVRSFEQAPVPPGRFGDSCPRSSGPTSKPRHGGPGAGDRRRRPTGRRLRLSWLGGRTLHVLDAPSPAATASLEIGAAKSLPASSSTPADHSDSQIGKTHVRGRRASRAWCPRIRVHGRSSAAKGVRSGRRGRGARQACAGCDRRPAPIPG